MSDRLKALSCSWQEARQRQEKGEEVGLSDQLKDRQEEEAAPYDTLPRSGLHYGPIRIAIHVNKTRVAVERVVAATRRADRTFGMKSEKKKLCSL